MKARPKPNLPFQTPTLLAGALLLLIIFVSAGYIIATQPVEGDSKSAEIVAFENAKRLWQLRKPDAFRYTVDRDCFCSESFREPYLVIERFAQSEFSLVEDRGIAPPEPLGVDGIFDLLENALSDADLVTVTYDTEFGFPDNLRIDWHSDLADEEQAFYIREFRAIP